MRTLLTLSLLLFLGGCDGLFGSDEVITTPATVRITGVEIAAVQATPGNGTLDYEVSDTLRGLFRFSVGGTLEAVMAGVCGGEACLPAAQLLRAPFRTTLRLDTAIVADGVTVVAGEDLSPLIAGESRSVLFGSTLVENFLNLRQGINPRQTVWFDPARVHVPDGRRTLSIRWEVGADEVFEDEATFDYQL